MRILVGAEFSGRVRDAFKNKGWDAWSCDLLPTEVPGQHIQDDILKHLDEDWDLAIFHPPCTRLCNSGVMWLNKRNLWEEMKRAALFFKSLLEAPIPKICIENPIPHKYALEIIGAKYSQIINPFQFGHLESKSTCLWLKNLPKLVPTTPDLKKEMLKLDRKEYMRVHYLPPSKDRWKIRSLTYEGIARAFAEQWGVLS